MTVENEEEFGNDPILIYQGDMWLGGKFLNIIFRQNLPRSEKHRISLVENKIASRTFPNYRKLVPTPNSLLHHHTYYNVTPNEHSRLHRCLKFPEFRVHPAQLLSYSPRD